jgi:hypothetical protein
MRAARNAQWSEHSGEEARCSLPREGELGARAPNIGQDDGPSGRRQNEAAHRGDGKQAAAIYPVRSTSSLRLPGLIPRRPHNGFAFGHKPSSLGASINLIQLSGNPFHDVAGSPDCSSFQFRLGSNLFFGLSISR